MPRYFFNVHDDVIAEDDEGVELPDLAAARTHALIGARGMIAEQVKHGYFMRSHVIKVVDEQRTAVFTLAFGDAVDCKE